MVAAFGAEDLANGFPVCDVDIDPSVSLVFREGGLRRFDVLGDIGLNVEDVGIFVEALEERRISLGWNGREQVTEYGSVAGILSVVEDVEDGVHVARMAR